MSRAPRSKTARRFWGDDDSATPIMHVDMDAFFVSVELRENPHLRGVPLAVGGQERGVISAASYEARVFGVNSAMPVGRAKRLCPQLVILTPHGEKYRDVSRRIMNILSAFTPKIEQVSVDEAFLDVSGSRRLFGSPVRIGHELRRRIREQEHVPASVGIANTKHLAKIASAHAKPDGLLLVPADRSLEFLHSLPVGALLGVGDKTREVLERRGVVTIGDVALLGRRTLVKILGAAAGERIYQLAMNHDERSVESVRAEKSMSREQTFFDPLRGYDEVEKVLLAQSFEVGRRLRADREKAGVISIKVRSASFATVQRSVTLAVPTDSNSDIYAAARKLFSSLEFPSEGVRLVGVRASQLVGSDTDIQLAFTAQSDERFEKVDRAIDAVQEKYGVHLLKPGTLYGA